MPDGPELLSIPAIGLDQQTVVWPALDEPLTYVLAVVAVNEGEGTEYIEDLRVQNLERTLGEGATDGSGARQLPPRDRVTWAFRPERAQFDLADGFIAIAVLASDRQVTTGPHVLDDRLRALIAQHNADVSQRPGLDAREPS